MKSRNLAWRLVRQRLRNCTDEQLAVAKHSLFALARCECLPAGLFQALASLAEEEAGNRQDEVSELERLYFRA